MNYIAYIVYLLLQLPSGNDHVLQPAETRHEPRSKILFNNDVVIFGFEDFVQL